MPNTNSHLPFAPKSRAWLGITIGGLVLALLWLIAAVLEPHLIQAAVSPSAAVNARSSASGWANSHVWLIAELLCIAVALLAGFLSRRVSPARSWAAPFVLMAVCALYVFFTQFPATRVPWRLALWSLGVPLALPLGAWLSPRQRSAT
jgi:MFS-type transporter involved in bile tolerance (Atg22 family)